MVASYGSNGLMLNSVNATADVRQGRRKRGARKKKRRRKRKSMREGFPKGSAMKSSLAVQETHVGSLGQEDPLEEEMATHSSILAWKIS